MTEIYVQGNGGSLTNKYHKRLEVAKPDVDSGNCGIEDDGATMGMQFRVSQCKNSE